MPSAAPDATEPGPPAAGDDSRRLSTGSIRRRVVIAILALLLAVITTLCVIVNLILSRRMHDDARNQITERARYASTLSSRGLSNQDLADDLTGEGIFASIIGSGSVVVGRDQQPPQGPSGPSGPAGGSGPGARSGGNPNQPGGQGAPASNVSIVVVDDGNNLRVTLNLPSGDGKIRLVSSLAEIQRTLALLHRVEIGTASATLVLAALVLVLIVGAALAPLRRMRLVADRIRQGARGTRLRPTKPGTDLGRTALAIDEMLEALETAESQARAAQERMRQLLADVSHDLRTPIAGVLNSAEELLQHDPGRRAREAGLVDLIREGRRAARLVDDLLLMTRLDAGEPLDDGSSNPADAADALALAVDALRRRRPDCTVHLTTVAASVHLDADRLIRIFTNLLDNAGKAAGPGGVVRVDMTLRGRDSSSPRVCVSISDDGSGVPEGYGDRIFDRLVRLDSSRHSAGSGLGLPIARALARTADGDVKYVGPAWPDGAGAIFEIVLPLTTAGDDGLSRS